jgi:hypothetical protein
MAFVKKEISKKNTEIRTIYSKAHYWQTMDNFFQSIIWTDEVYIGPVSLCPGEVLRELAQRCL